MNRARPHRTLVASVAALALVALAAGPALAAPRHPGPPAPHPTPARGWSKLAPGAEPSSNPLKGFIPYEGAFDTFPYSMEWSYFPLNAVMKGRNDFDWTAVEAALNDIESRGHQSAIRFYIDYPGEAPGLPRYLLDQPDLVRHSYTDFGNNGISVSPDYNDPRVRAALDSFIAAFGKKYDGDPRLGFVQAGLLGFWGEWHTWPHNGYVSDPTTYNPAEDWFANPDTQNEVLTDFVHAFAKTRLEVRNPDAANASLPIGYHDDSFAYETKTSSLGWHFMDNMVAAGATDKWKTQSIGGELRPEIQQCLFSVTEPCSGIPAIQEDGADFDFAGSVAQTHASWLLNHYAFTTGYTGDDYTRALAASTSLGYSFRATDALVPAKTAKGATAVVGVTIANVGVAPFYYPWPITLAAVDRNGKVAASTVTGWHVSDIAVGALKRFTANVSTAGLAPGAYKVVIQVTNPMAGGQPIRFANAAQDSAVAGWLTLGTGTITSRRR